MHIVVIDPQTAVPTHIFICASEGKESKKKSLDLKQELIFARALGEELAISRSLFVFMTPATYEIFIVKDRNDDSDYEYTYRRARSMRKASDWLMHDKSVFSLDAAIIAVDSEDLTLTINVRPSSRALIEDIDGYEELKLDEEITKLFP